MDSATFNQKIDIEWIIHQQILKVNNAAFSGLESEYSNAIESLLMLLPKVNQEKIENKKEEYEETSEKPVFKMSCGRPMGSVENPVYRNKPTDWNYDKSRPAELVSPTMLETTTTNYQTKYKLILQELESLGITWRVEAKDRTEKRVNKPATPLLVLDGKEVRVMVKKGIEGLSTEPEIAPDEYDEEFNEEEEEFGEDKLDRTTT
jgi:hypothetical protein